MKTLRLLKNERDGWYEPFEPEDIFILQELGQTKSTCPVIPCELFTDKFKTVALENGYIVEVHL